MSRGRLLLACHHRAVEGGLESYLRALLPRLRESGWDTALLYEREPAPGQPLIDEGLEGMPAWSVAALGPRGALQAVAGWRPDVLYQQGLVALELEQALLERWPTVFFLHAYLGLCISGSRRHTLPRPQPCQRSFGPGCLVHYLPRGCGGRNPLTLLRDYRSQQQRLALLRRYPTVLVGSHAMRLECLRHGLAEAQVACVPLFSDGARDSSPPPPRPPRGKVLMVGRLTDLKGGLELIRALPLASARLGRALELVVAGEGSERRRMESEAAARGVAVRFAGWVGRTERQRLMREADVLAVPSLWPEPFGLVGVEAGGVGLPGVAFAVGGIVDWCEPGVSGELAPGLPPTAEGLAEALVRALGSAEHHARLREGAWRMAARFTPEAHLQALQPWLERAAWGASTRWSRVGGP